MVRDDLIYIEHMLLYAERIASKLLRITRTEFEHDQDLKDLIVYRLQVIGEAASHISDEFQHRYPQIDWSNIIGLRHRLVHGYLDIDYGIVWEIAVDEVPVLIEELQNIIKQSENL